MLLNRRPERGAPMKPPPVGTAFLLSQAGAHAAMGFADRLKALNLKPYDAGILRMLGSNPGHSQQTLSGLLGMFPSQLVAVLDALESRHLIERRNQPADRRSYRLYLSRTGRKTLNEIGKLTLRLEEDLFAALSQREKNTLQEFLRRIIAQQEITPGVHPAYRQIGRR